ncbi:ankyrin repeat domain-containing protein [unidentified bacterial endosymbiont]|uniref:ankyrin repeat domain-containing protein n=1 Tax=unidentified bacterial endosymbiont TaxID=2355 RepID=UPI00209F7EFA|nr:ankyrin repeat domain-containing protein [unidentified bacterial endosymbiont]
MLNIFRSGLNPVYHAPRTLYEALQKNDIEGAKLLITSGVDIDQVIELDRPLLHIALISKNIEFSKLLIESGADINKESYRGDTSLHVAAGIGDIKIVKLLIKNRANTNHANNQGRTPFHRAVTTGDIKIVKLLIKNGANIYHADNEGRTPLFMSLFQNIKFISSLIKLGADFNKRDPFNKTLAYRALELGRSETFKFLASQGADISQCKNGGKNISYNVTFLHKAVEECDIELAKILIKNGSNIDEVNTRGVTALEVALDLDYIELAKTFILEGADINILSGSNKAYDFCSRAVHELKIKLSSIIEKMTLSDFLKEENQENLVSYLRDKSITSTLISLRNNDSLIFNNFIENKYKEAEEQKSLIDQFREIPLELSQELPILPPELVEKIGYYLPKNDQKKLINSFLDPGKMTEDCAALPVDENSLSAAGLTDDEKHQEVFRMARPD